MSGRGRGRGKRYTPSLESVKEGSSIGKREQKNPPEEFYSKSKVGKKEVVKQQKAQNKREKEKVKEQKSVKKKASEVRERAKMATAPISDFQIAGAQVVTPIYGTVAPPQPVQARLVNKPLFEGVRRQNTLAIPTRTFGTQTQTYNPDVIARRANPIARAVTTGGNVEPPPPYTGRRSRNVGTQVNINPDVMARRPDVIATRTPIYGVTARPAQRTPVAFTPVPFTPAPRQRKPTKPKVMKKEVKKVQKKGFKKQFGSYSGGGGGGTPSQGRTKKPVGQGKGRIKGEQTKPIGRGVKATY